MDTTPVPPAPISVAPQPYVSVMPKRRMNPAAVAGIIIVVALVGYGAYAYFSDSWPFAPAGEPMISESPSPSASASPTAGWKTYTNTEFGFQLMFPDEWAGYFVTRHAVQRSDFPSGAGMDAEFERQKGNVNINFHLKDSNPDFPVFGITAYTKTFWSTVDNDEFFTRGYLGEQGEFVFVVGYAQDGVSAASLSQAEQIISTFKFITPTAGWKTYTNLQLGFELKFPENWSNYVVRLSNSPGTTSAFQFAYNSSAQPGQSFQILVYTPAQWDAELKLDQPHPDIVARSTDFVFATPFRFEFNNLPGEGDIDEILATFRLTK